MIGVSQQAINSYENSQTQPDFVILIRIADYFQVSLDYLLGRKISSRLPLDLIKYSFDQESMSYTRKYLSLTREQKKALNPVIEIMQNKDD